MNFNPDTQALYVEAIDLQGRVEAYEERRLEFLRLLRDKELELLTNGSISAEGEEKLHIARLRANIALQEEHAELFAFLDREHGYIEGVRARNEAIIAAGWAEAFAVNSLSRRLQDEPPKGIEQ